MRIVHTSDWHAGRVWKGVERLSELAAVLEHLGDHIERERVDLVLVSGDIFDNGAPQAEAERLVFGFFKRLGRAQVRTIVIAGNHDNAARVEAWGQLAELVGVSALGRPRPAAAGGVIEVELRSGERASIAAVPFAAPRFLLSALELGEDEVLSRQRYADGFRRIIEALWKSCRPEHVRILMAHTHLQGARLAGSEREVHVGDEWAATPQALPTNAHYVALGHIHRPQKVDAAAAPTYYAGSPLQLDFGEVGQEKSFLLVDARAGQPVRVECVPYQGGRELRDVRASLAEIDHDAERLRTMGWLRVTVPMASRDPDLNSKVRRSLPNALVVHPELPVTQDEPRATPALSASPTTLFRAYVLAERHVEPDPALVEAFETVHEQEGSGRASDQAAR